MYIYVVEYFDICGVFDIGVFECVLWQVICEVQMLYMMWIVLDGDMFVCVFDVVFVDDWMFEYVVFVGMKDVYVIVFVGMCVYCMGVIELVCGLFFCYMLYCIVLDYYYWYYGYVYILVDGYLGSLIVMCVVELYNVFVLGVKVLFVCFVLFVEL